MSEPVIRMLESGDLPQLPPLYADLDVFSNTLQLPYPAPEQVWRDLMSRPGHTSLVAVRGDEVLGHSGIDIGQRLRRRHVATFGVAVKESARRRGVASALVRAALDLCEDWSNVTRTELQVYTDNTAAIALYEKFGFVIEGTHVQYAIRNGGLVDAHCMARLRGTLARSA